MAAADKPAQIVELVGRRASLFTRVAAMFAEGLGVPWRLKHVADMTVLDTDTFAGNPAMKIPALRIDGHVVFGTENICRALAAKAAELRVVQAVWTEDLPDHLSRNAQELVWHCMASQVQLVMGTVIGDLPADSAFFMKTRTSMEASLHWLDRNVDEVVEALPAGRDISLFETTLFCLVEHLSFRPTVAVTGYRKLRDFAARYGTAGAAAATSYRRE